MWYKLEFDIAPHYALQLAYTLYEDCLYDLNTWPFVTTTTWHQLGRLVGCDGKGDIPVQGAGPA